MSSLWLNDNRLVMDSGQLVLCAICPCPSGTGTGTLIDCDACLGGVAADEMEVGLSGIINQLCSNCANYNGTFVLPFYQVSGNTCYWQESWANLGVSGCTGDYLTLSITYTTFTYIRISLGTLSPDYYEKTYSAGPKEDCTTLNTTLTKVGSGGLVPCGLVYGATATVQAR